MAKRQSPDDWYLISIDRLKKIGLTVLIVALLGSGYLYWDRSAKNPQERAESAIADADGALNDLAGSKDFNSFKSEFDRGKTKLEEARTLFGEAKYPEAESAAIESETIAKTALAKLPGEGDSDAQFLSAEGNVEYQKAASTDWRKADVRIPLFNGDWVKTGNSASAELIFSNGSLYTVGPNALLEIYAVFNPQTSKKQNSIKMDIGSVEINTTDDTSTVNTPGTQVVVNSESTAQVGVGKQQDTQIVSLKGTSSVAPNTGEPPVALASGEQVEASKEGSLSTVSKYVLPPALLSPSDNQVFQGTADSRVPLVWNAQPAATAYKLQVSRSRLFSRMEVDARRNNTSATVKITSEGIFYWRAASLDSRGIPGPFSPFRRFRMTGLGTGSLPGVETDKTPPTLQLGRPRPIGGAYYMIVGKAEPGASVFVNDEQISVESDGTFQKLIGFTKVGLNKVIVKAVDPAGNQSVQTADVRVEEE